MRAIALGIACEIHPLNNLRVLRYLVRDLKVTDEQKDAWYRHWVEQGLAVDRGAARGGEQVRAVRARRTR